MKILKLSTGNKIFLTDDEAREMSSLLLQSSAKFVFLRGELISTYLIWGIFSEESYKKIFSRPVHNPEADENERKRITEADSGIRSSEGMYGIQDELNRDIQPSA